MSAQDLLSLSLNAALLILSAALLLCVWRVIRGPSLPDRVLALDMLVAVAIGYIAVIGIRTGYALYVDIAIALGLATYPLYLTHAYVGQALMVGAARLGIAPGLSVGPVILLMVCLSLFIALRVEPILRRRMDRMLRPIFQRSARAAV